jgi:hypothetical protein
MHVQTREGIFNGGGYGGGVFDGSEMGFGGIGGYEQAPAGVGGLTAPNQWTIKTNEWPSTVSQAVVKSPTRWKELPAANPGMTLVTINGQPNLSPWKVGQVVNLPASWVPTQAPPPPADTAPAQIPATPPPANPASSVRQMSFGDRGDAVDDLQDYLNGALLDAGYKEIPFTGVYDNATCGAISWMFAQGGFSPDIPSSPPGTQWIFNTCPAAVKPTKADEPVQPTKTGTSMAWMVGGLVGAAALAGLYLSKKRK